MNSSNNFNLSIINRAAAFILGMGGIDLSPTDFYLLHPEIRNTFKYVLSDSKCIELFRETVLNYSCIARIPLLDINKEITDGSNEGWHLPLDYRNKIMSNSLYSKGLPSGDKMTMVVRLESINLEKLGEIIESHICDYFLLSNKPRLSIVVFGSFIWKKRFNDIDLIVIVENGNTYCPVEVGSYSLICPDVSIFLDNSLGISTENINISLVGRCAILRNVYSHDLCNIATWGNIGGLCLKGKPIANQISDFMLLQKVFISMGFFFKNSLVEKKILEKGRENTIECLQIFCFLGEKYNAPNLDILLGLLSNAINAQEQTYSQENLVRDANEISLHAFVIADLIKTFALNRFPFYSEKL